MAGRLAWRVSGRTLLAKTCTHCCELKDACDFRIRPDGYWQSWCNACQHKTAKLSNAKINSESQPTATKSRQDWTTGEIKQLRTYLDQGLMHKEIAKRMSRSMLAITVAKNRYLKE